MDTVRQRRIERRTPYVRQIAELRKRTNQGSGRIAGPDRLCVGNAARGAQMPETAVFTGLS